MKYVRRMLYCSSCNRDDVPETWEFCPRCGAPNLISAAAHAAAQANRPQSAAGGFLDIALNVAETFVQGQIARKLQTVDRMLGGGPSASAAPAADGAPRWYASAAAEQQPEVDPAERAMRDARSISNAREATQRAQMMVDHMRSINDAMTRNWRR